jgi:hypothetical protein
VSVDIKLEALRQDPFKVAELRVALAPNIRAAVRETLSRYPSASDRDLLAAGQLYVLQHAAERLDVPLHTYLYQRLRDFLIEQARGGVAPVHVPRRRPAVGPVSLSHDTEDGEEAPDLEVDRALNERMAEVEDGILAEHRVRSVQAAVGALPGEKRRAAEAVMAGKSVRTLAVETGQTRRAVAQLRTETLETLRPQLAQVLS